MYSNQSVSYAFNVTEGANYFAKIQSAQVTDKATPSADYKFNLNVYVDGVLKGNYNFSAIRVFTDSQFISLGNLGIGVHTIRLDWLNDMNSATYDANLGMKNLSLYKDLAS